tara:strand:- start:265 stop:507 length:243 start_codon:yes stop_codon:yes gene_type:complete
MLHAHKDLAQEHPEYKEAIHRMKMEDAHFARLFEEYGKLDREVQKMEENVEPVSDEVLENAKKGRLALKDKLFAMLQAAK